MNTDIIRITFLGDIMCSIPEMVYSQGSDNKYTFNSVFEEISDYLKQSDIVCANLETPIAGHELNYTSETTLFNTPKEFALAVRKSGINIVTTANNHCLDRGIEGLKRTIDNLDDVGLEHTGTFKTKNEKRYLVKTVLDKKIAFISYTYGTDPEYRNNDLYEEEEFYANIFNNGEAFPVTYSCSKFKNLLKLITPEIIKRIARDSTYLDCGSIDDLKTQKGKRLLSRMKDTINQAREECDYVFMCLHIGGQYNSEIGEYTKYIASFCIECGCDYVIGNHPHCVLKYEFLNKDKLIAYSLGNFSFTPNWGYYVDGVLSDYSIILHFDFLKDSPIKSSFSISKSIRWGDHTKVVLVYDLYTSQTDKTRLYKDCKLVVERFVGHKIEKFEMKREYELNKIVYQ